MGPEAAAHSWASWQVSQSRARSLPQLSCEAYPLGIAAGPSKLGAACFPAQWQIHWVVSTSMIQTIAINLKDDKIENKQDFIKHAVIVGCQGCVQNVQWGPPSGVRVLWRPNSVHDRWWPSLCIFYFWGCTRWLATGRHASRDGYLLGLFSGLCSFPACVNCNHIMFLDIRTYVTRVVGLENICGWNVEFVLLPFKWAGKSRSVLRSKALA